MGAIVVRESAEDDERRAAAVAALDRAEEPRRRRSGEPAGPSVVLSLDVVRIVAGIYREAERLRTALA